MTHDKGSSLLEALVSLATMLLVITVLVPYLGTTRRLVSGLAQRAARIDTTRLVASRLTDEIRHAGFGLGGPGAVVAGNGATLSLTYLDGGFDGGHAVASRAPAGSTWLELQTIGDLGPGQDVVIIDIWGRTIEGQLRAVHRSTRSVELALPLPRDVLPEEGARLYASVTRTWSTESAGLRRDGRLVSDDLALAARVPTALDGPAEWLAGGVLDRDGRTGAGEHLILGAIRPPAADLARQSGLVAPVATRIRQPHCGSPRP